MKEEEEGEREEEEGEREGERWVCKNWWRAPKNVSWSSPILLWMSQVQCKILPFSSFAHSFQNFEEKKKSMERTVLRRFFPIFLSSRPVIHHINFPKDFLSPPLSPLPLSVLCALTHCLLSRLLFPLPLSYPWLLIVSTSCPLQQKVLHYYSLSLSIPRFSSLIRYQKIEFSNLDNIFSNSNSNFKTRREKLLFAKKLVIGMTMWTFLRNFRFWQIEKCW